MTSGFREHYIRDARGNIMAIYKYTNSGTPSTSDCGYCDNSYTATSSSPSSWSTIAMGNSGDGIQVRCPDCPESEAGFFHGLAYGSDFGGLNAGGNDLGGAHVSGPGSQRSYEHTGAGAPGDGAHWTRTTAPTGGTPPATAGVVDAGVIAGLEGASLTCCGSFEPPVFAQKQGYRFGFNGKENDNEWHGATGTFQDYGMRAYDTRVGRFFSVDPLSDKFPMLTPYQFASNTPIWAIDLDGAEAWVYTETDNFGHTFIVVPTDNDVTSLTVYTYGRYNGSYTPSLGGAAPFGDGVLIKYTGKDATDFIQERLMLGNGKSTFAFEFPKADAGAIRDHFDKMFAAGQRPPEGSKADQDYGDKARIIDTYKLVSAGGSPASTCVTKTCEGLIVGGALDDFAPAANGQRNDGGAYLDLRMQGDPKTFGAYLFMMGAQDAKQNAKDRNVITVVPNQKTD